MQHRSNMELRCYAYRRGEVWEAICTDLDVAVFGPSVEHVKRSLAEAIDLHLAAVVGLPDEDRQAMLSRRAPWHVRFALELLFRMWRKCESGDRVRRSFVVHPQIALPGTAANLIDIASRGWRRHHDLPADDEEEQRQFRAQIAPLIGSIHDESLQGENASQQMKAILAEKYDRSDAQR